MALSREKRAIIGIVLLVGTAAVLWGVARYFGSGEEHAATFYKEMNDSCIKAGTESLRSKGIDPAANGMPQKIEAYCGCIVAEAKSKQLASSSIDPISPDGQAKTAELTQACAARLQ
jgi:hypothetical protein